jgi:hypothetical protein
MFVERSGFIANPYTADQLCIAASLVAVFDRIVDEVRDRVEKKVPITSREDLRSPAAKRRTPLFSAAASKSSTTSRAISAKFTVLKPATRSLASI